MQTLLNVSYCKRYANPHLRASPAAGAKVMPPAKRACPALDIGQAVAARQARFCRAIQRQPASVICHRECDFAIGQRHSDGAPPGTAVANDV